MRRFGLIGYPLTHSFSKEYFSNKFDREGITGCTYELFPMDSLSGLRSLLERYPDLEGLNVTIPYKEEVLSFLDHRDPLVTAIDACNCISIKNGNWTGYNTDVSGFRQSLAEKLLPHHKKALILGTGGASKAVRFVLAEAGIEYRHVSRKPSVNNYSYEQVTRDILKEYTLIINTTPLGMYPSVNEAPPIPYEAISPSHYLFDLVYNPEKTLFLKKGEEQGAQIKNGHDMLIIQAEESWRIWESV